MKTADKFRREVDNKLGLQAMDCFSIDPMDITFCDVNRPCEQCPRYADDCDGEEDEE